MCLELYISDVMGGGVRMMGGVRMRGGVCEEGMGLVDSGW